MTLLFVLPASSTSLPSAPSWFRSLSDSHCLDTANGQGLGLDNALLLLFLPYTVRLQHLEDEDTFSVCWVIWMFPQLHRVLTRSKGSFKVREGSVRVKRTWMSSCLDANSDTTSFCLVLTSVRDTCSFPRAISWALGGRRRSSRFCRSLAMREPGVSAPSGLRRIPFAMEATSSVDACNRHTTLRFQFVTDAVLQEQQKL